MAAVAALPVILLIALPWWALLICVVLLAAWMAFYQVGRQTWSLTEIGLSTLSQRVGSSSVVVAGVAGVVAVLVGLLAMGAGLESTLKRTGTNDTAIVLQDGAGSEISSAVDHDTAAIVSQASQVLRNAQGQSIASPELVMGVAIPKKSSGLDAGVEVRGVGERAWDLRPDVKMIAGRRFKPGLRELVVGKGVHSEFRGMDLGLTLNLSGQPWTVVGIFDSGDAHNSEIWGDTEVIGPAYHREGNTTSVVVRLVDSRAFQAFREGLAKDPRLRVEVETTRAYYQKQSESLVRIIRTLGIAVGAIMAIGAVFGAINTMYTAIAVRTREIATLRAMGFGSVPVIVSVLLETVLLAMTGGAIGVAIAWVVFNGFTASTAVAGSGQVVFAFNVSPDLLWNGLKWALAIGLIGGIFPALRAARMGITIGLRGL